MIIQILLPILTLIIAVIGTFYNAKKDGNVTVAGFIIVIVLVVLAAVTVVSGITRTMAEEQKTRDLNEKLKSAELRDQRLNRNIRLVGKANLKEDLTDLKWSFGKIALFEETNQQDHWYLRGPGGSSETSPVIDKGYSRLASLIEENAYAVDQIDVELDFVSKLQAAEVFVIVTPWNQYYDSLEMLSTWEFVNAGGRLLVLGYYMGDVHHSTNVNGLLRPFGISVMACKIMKTGVSVGERAGHIQGTEVVATGNVHSSFSQGLEDKKVFLEDAAGLEFRETEISNLVIMESGQDSLVITPPDVPELTETATNRVRKSDLGDKFIQYISWGDERVKAEQKSLPVIVAREYGKGKIVVAGSWKLFHNEWMTNEYGNSQLFANIFSWLTSDEASGNMENE